MNSRWFKNRCGELESRKEAAAARRKRLNLIRILCLLLFGLGFFGFYLLSLRFPSLTRLRHALLVPTSVAFYYSGLTGFAVFPLFGKRKRPESEDAAESDNRKADAVPSRKFRGAVLIAVGALCPALFLRWNF